MWRQNSQRRPPTYESVRLVAEVLSHINADLNQRHFSINADVATDYMARLIADNLFGEVLADGWHYPMKRRRQVREAPVTSVDAFVEDADHSLLPLEVDRLPGLKEEVRVLKARIKRLQDAGKTVIVQREAWRVRALTAEELLEAERNRHAGGLDRFDALRRLVAKELHPDFCNSGPA